MSAQPSPGPSQAIMHAASATTPAARPRHTPGIQAGAQEEKYRQKTRTLRKKIKEIETENDKLYTKTLQAKRNIQRLRIERAILYERLQPQPPPASPPPPQQQQAQGGPPLPPAQYTPQQHPAQPPPPPRGHYPPHDIPPEHDLPPADYYRHAPPRAYAAAAGGPPPRADIPRHHGPLPPQQPQAPPPPRGAYPRSPVEARHYVQSQPPGPPPPDVAYSREYAPAERYRGRSPSPGPRMHAHQRLGPGTNINNVHGQPELDAQREARDSARVREWEEQERRRRAGGGGAGRSPGAYRDREAVYHPPPQEYAREYARPSAEREYVHPHAHGHGPPPPPGAEREYVHGGPPEREYTRGPPPPSPREYEREREYAHPPPADREYGSRQGPPPSRGYAPEEINGRSRSTSVGRGYYDREYERDYDRERERGGGPLPPQTAPARYHDPQDVGAAETMQRMRSGSTAGGGGGEYHRRRSVDSDVDMDERGGA